MKEFLEAINEVKATMEADTYGVDPSVPLVTPELVPPIKVHIHGYALETRTDTSAFDDIVKDFDTLDIKLSKLALSEVYGFQQAVTLKIWLRENVVSYQATKQ